MKPFLVLVFSIVSFISFGQLQLAYNKSFELHYNNAASGWLAFDSHAAYKISYTNAEKHTGHYSLLIDGRKANREADDYNAAIFSFPIPADLLKGKKKAKLEAWIKTDSHDTRAFIWLNQYGGKDTAAIPVHEAFADTVVNKNGWQHIQVELTLDSSAAETYFGGVSNGPGKAWFDDFTLYLDDVAVDDTAKAIAQPSTAELAWLNKQTVTLTSVLPNANNTDLDSLSKWSGDSKVIAVGEPTHGTREAALFKHRFFRYLVENKGFNIFMLEDNFSECSLINDYVLHRGDSVLDLRKVGLFPVGQNEEMAELIDWMRNYNQTHADKIQFMGMDMQSSKVALLSVKKFADKYDKMLLPYINELMQSADSITSLLDINKHKSEWPHIRKAMDSLTLYTDKNIPVYYSSVPKDTANFLVLNLTILKQLYPNLPSEVNPQYRDSCMAKNVYDICQLYPKGKIFIWAHNAHIEKASLDDSPMGKRLKDYFGNSYYAVGITTATGQYTATESVRTRIFHAYPLVEPYLGTAEYYFEKGYKKDFILPLNKDTDNIASAWLNKEIYFRGIGFSQQNEQFGVHNLRKQFDAVIFIRKTTNTRNYLLNKDN